MASWALASEGLVVMKAVCKPEISSEEASLRAGPVSRLSYSIYLSL